jgi:hypothetical protein
VSSVLVACGGPASSNAGTPVLGGLAGADAMCQARAQARNSSGTFKAWLSTDTDVAARVGAERLRA